MRFDSIFEPMRSTAVADGPTDIQLDLSGVSDFDTAGVQLLLMVHREALVRGRNLKFAAASNIVREVLTLFGALGLLMDASSMEGRP